LIISDIFLVKSFLINQRFTRLGSDTFSSAPQGQASRSRKSIQKELAPQSKS